jgi:hypothetical protein
MQEAIAEAAEWKMHPTPTNRILMDHAKGSAQFQWPDLVPNSEGVAGRKDKRRRSFTEHAARHGLGAVRGG